MQKSALITDCSSGIGLASAQVLQKLSYKILTACRKQDYANTSTDYFSFLTKRADTAVNRRMTDIHTSRTKVIKYLYQNL
ncbi:hypothetical protein [Cedecea lapagei]|uniref:hypothetical protein n=1 Tax=Cedecea lapagei TaxID=158823 RepID=UPI001E49766E|nr:hypothetical protein [Cedecea lapagei]